MQNMVCLQHDLRDTKHGRHICLCVETVRTPLASPVYRARTGTDRRSRLLESPRQHVWYAQKKGKPNTLVFNKTHLRDDAR